MKNAQPNRTLTNIVNEIEHLAARSNRLAPTLSADEAYALRQELCTIRELIHEATVRLSVLQVKYPDQVKAAK